MDEPREPSWIMLQPTLEACPPRPTPCGGNLAGFWRLQQICHDADEFRQQANGDAQGCASLTAVTIFVLGSLEVDAEGAVEPSLAVDITLEMTVPASCATRPCSEYSQGSRTCGTAVSGCLCTASTVYEDTENAALIRDRIEAGDYCVRGDQLLVADGDRAIVFERGP